jgi:hypothetical protein
MLDLKQQELKSSSSAQSEKERAAQEETSKLREAISAAEHEVDARGGGDWGGGEWGGDESMQRLLLCCCWSLSVGGDGCVGLLLGGG